jgi:hypothetical protein
MASFLMLGILAGARQSLFCGSAFVEVIIAIMRAFIAAAMCVAAFRPLWSATSAESVGAGTKETVDAAAFSTLRERGSSYREMPSRRAGAVSVRIRPTASCFSVDSYDGIFRSARK